MMRYHPDVFVYKIPLPKGVNEVVLPCEGGYTVYISSRLSPEKSQEAYEHAVGHIENDDFDKICVQEIEEEAH